MMKIIRNFRSSIVGSPPDDRLKTTSQLPKIIVTTASLDHLDSAEKLTSAYLRPLDTNVATVIPRPTRKDEIASVSEEAAVSNESNVKNLQYEWIGEPLEQHPAPDGGWGWLVLLAALFMACTLMSLGPCFGVLFNTTMRAMGVSSANVAWIFNANMFSWNLSAIVSGPLIKHFGWRVVGCTSSFLLALSFILLAFAWSPLYIFFMFGGLIGAMSGIAAMTCILILPAYFNKRRGMANSIFSCGISLGYIIFPVLIRYLQDEFGFFGATIIHGAILLNCCVACALFRPLKTSVVHHPKSAEKFISESERVEPLLSLNPESQSTSNPKKPSSLTAWGLFLDVLKTTFDNLKAMKHKPLLLTTTSIAVFLTGSLNYVSLLPFALRHHGYSAKEASYAVSMIGIGNILIRIAVSFIADAKWLNRKYVYILGLIISGLCSFLTPVMMSNYSYLMGVFVLWGVGMALSSCMYFVVLIDVVGLSYFESGTSILAFLLAFFSIFAGPFVGYIRDATSSYTWSLTAVAALQGGSAFLWLFMPSVQRRHDRRLFHGVNRPAHLRSGKQASNRRDTYPVRRSPAYYRHGQVPLRRSTYPTRPAARPPMNDATLFWRNSSIPRVDGQQNRRKVSPADDAMHISVPQRLEPNSERVLLDVYGKSLLSSSPSHRAQ